jgi:lipopolysaccharide/colanic/teichoic acid biosynthesis glycosyltransferase
VIFSTDGLSFTDILSVIARCKSRTVNFRLVPNSLEAIIGKASIDELDAIPLVEIEYNIHKPTNRFVKRLFDLAVGLILLHTLYPVKMLSLLLKGKARHAGSTRSWVVQLPKVVSGKLSFVGLPLDEPDEKLAEIRSIGVNGQASYLGPKGLTGLVQLYRRMRLEGEEIENAKLYYAKNQSLMLDLEILLKSVLGKH